MSDEPRHVVKPDYVHPFADPYAKLPSVTPVLPEAVEGDGIAGDGVILFPTDTQKRVPPRQRVEDPTIDLDVLGELAREWINERFAYLEAQPKAEKAFIFTRAIRVLRKAGFTAYSRDAVIYLASEIPKNYYKTIVNTTKGHLIALCKWLVETGRIDRPIGEFVKWGHGKVYEQRKPITAEDYAKLKTTAKTSEMTWLLILGWHTGFSVIDCATLKWEDVNMTECAIRKRREKTGVLMTNCFDSASELGIAIRLRYDAARIASNGAIPTGPVEPKLAMHVRPKSGPVNNNPLHASTSFDRIGHLRIFLRDLFRDANVPKSFHSFRTRWATEIVNSGVNLIVAAQTTGHKSVQMLSRYVRPDPVALKAAATIGVGFGSTNHVTSSQADTFDPNENRAVVGGVYRIHGRKPKVNGVIVVKYVRLTVVPPGDVDVVGVPVDVEGDPIAAFEIAVPRLTLHRIKPKLEHRGHTQPELGI